MIPQNMFILDAFKLKRLTKHQLKPTNALTFSVPMKLIRIHQVLIYITFPWNTSFHHNAWVFRIASFFSGRFVSASDFPPPAPAGRPATDRSLPWSLVFFVFYWCPTCGWVPLGPVGNLEFPTSPRMRGTRELTYEGLALVCFNWDFPS